MIDHHHQNRQPCHFRRPTLSQVLWVHVPAIRMKDVQVEQITCVKDYAGVLLWCGLLSIYMLYWKRQ